MSVSNSVTIDSHAGSCGCSACMGGFRDDADYTDGGEIVYDIDNNVHKGYNGTTWNNLY